MTIKKRALTDQQVDDILEAMNDEDRQIELDQQEDGDIVIHLTPFLYFFAQAVIDKYNENIS